MSEKLNNVNDVVKKGSVVDATDSNKVIRTTELIPTGKIVTKEHVENFVKSFKKKHSMDDSTKEKIKKSGVKENENSTPSEKKQ